MTLIHLETEIEAPIERCFDLARSVDVHLSSMAHTGERAVAGVTSGEMDLGDTVTWEARHLGATRHVTSVITAFEPPNRFVDEQASGPFAYFRHVHRFEPRDGGCLMLDDFKYEVRYGWIGALGDRLVLARYMKRLLVRRNTLIREMAEKANGGHSSAQ